MSFLEQADRLTRKLAVYERASGSASNLPANPGSCVPQGEPEFAQLAAKNEALRRLQTRLGVKTQQLGKQADWLGDVGRAVNPMTYLKPFLSGQQQLKPFESGTWKGLLNYLPDQLKTQFMSGTDWQKAYQDNPRGAMVTNTTPFHRAFPDNAPPTGYQHAATDTATNAALWPGVAAAATPTKWLSRLPGASRLARIGRATPVLNHLASLYDLAAGNTKIIPENAQTKATRQRLDFDHQYPIDPGTGYRYNQRTGAYLANDSLPQLRAEHQAITDNPSLTEQLSEMPQGLGGWLMHPVKSIAQGWFDPWGTLSAYGYANYDNAKTWRDVALSQNALDATNRRLAAGPLGQAVAPAAQSSFNQQQANSAISVLDQQKPYMSPAEYAAELARYRGHNYAAEHNQQAQQLQQAAR